MIRRACLVLLLAFADAAGAVEVIDDDGRRVWLERPAQRIVTLAPHATELVTAAGAGSALVAVATGVDLPAGFDGLPRVGGPGPLDRERLLALRPDLVIGWGSGNRRADLDWIAERGIALFLSEPRSPGDIAMSLRAIGVLAGTAARADTAAATFERSLQTACRGLPAIPVYVRIWDRPAMSLGGRHWLNPLLRLAGFRNVLEGYDRGIMVIAPEAALGHATLRELSLVRRFDDSSEDRLADLLSRPGPRLAEAVGMLCRKRLATGKRATPDGRH